MMRAQKVNWHFFFFNKHNHLRTNTGAGTHAWERAATRRVQKSKNKKTIREDGYFRHIHVQIKCRYSIAKSPALMSPTLGAL